MVSVELQLQNPSGLHLRPAGILCKSRNKISIAYYNNDSRRNRGKCQKRTECSVSLCQIRG